MLYALLRSIAGIALRGFYRRIDVEGLERLPREAPLILAVNHPNALVDALVAAASAPAERRARGEAARQRYAERYSLERMVDAYAELLVDLAR